MSAQPEWTVIVGGAMAFLVLGWLAFIALIWILSVIGLVWEGIRFLRSPEEEAPCWEHRGNP